MIFSEWHHQLNKIFFSRFNIAEEAYDQGFIDGAKYIMENYYKPLPHDTNGHPDELYDSNSARSEGENPDQRSSATKQYVRNQFANTREYSYYGRPNQGMPKDEQDVDGDARAKPGRRVSQTYDDYPRVDTDRVLMKPPPNPRGTYDNAGRDFNEYRENSNRVGNHWRQR